MGKDLSQRVAAAVKYIQALDKDALKCGRYDVDENFFYLVQEYETKPAEEGRHEAHKNYVDIQYIAKGRERIEITASAFMVPEIPYDPKTDVVFFKEPKQAASKTLMAGQYAVFYPKDSHKPGLSVRGRESVKKIVGKVRI